MRPGDGDRRRDRASAAGRPRPQQHVDAEVGAELRLPRVVAQGPQTERRHPLPQPVGEVRQRRVPVLVEERRQFGGERRRRPRVPRVDTVVGLHAHQQQHAPLVVEVLPHRRRVAREAAVQDDHDAPRRAGGQHRRQQVADLLRAVEHRVPAGDHPGVAHLQVQLVGPAGDGAVPREVDQQQPLGLPGRPLQHLPEVGQVRRRQHLDVLLAEHLPAREHFAHAVQVVLDRRKVARHAVRRLRVVVLGHADQQRPVHQPARVERDHRPTCRRGPPVRLRPPAVRRPGRRAGWPAMPTRPA